MGGAMRALIIALAIGLAGALALPPAGAAGPPVPAQLPGIGIAAHRPVFGGACKTCPWGVVADVVKAALAPYGYDVQVCYHCFMADAPRIVGDARLPPPWNPHMGGAVIPDSFIPAPPNGRVEFGATADQFLIAAYDVSRRWKIPVMFRMTTRVCHSKTVVRPAAATPATRNSRKRPLP